MKLTLLTILSAASLCILPAQAQETLDTKIQTVIFQHYQTYRDREYFSAIQSSIQIGDKPLKTYVIGRISRDIKSRPIDAQTLFNLGSITKSFTAALMLMAEKDKKLKLEADFTQYLPEYAKWSGLSLTRLLNMSTGLPNYTDSPTLNYLVTQDLKRVWNERELIAWVYPQNLPVAPPLKPGYFYTNTAYILSGLILEKQFQQPFKTLLENYLLKPYRLIQTFYPIPAYSQDVQNRLARGYSYNNYNNPELAGRDVTDNNLSWAGAAGGLVANSEDVVRWVRVLFSENQLLDAQQKQKLMQIVSFKTGQPLAVTTADDPRGYGLGVAQGYDEEIGRHWFYEGETLGYRSLYLYVPCNQIIVSALFNSAVDDDNDHAGALLKQIYQTILQEYPQSQCKS